MLRSPLGVGQLLGLMALGLLAACGGDEFSAPSGSAGSAGSVGFPGPGCADGTREAFVDVATHPDIAGCSGGFELPGIAAWAAFSPTCSHQAGNHGVNPNGTGCSVEDLCAPEFHVCATHDDVRNSSGTGACDDSGTEPGIWIGRQALLQNQCTPSVSEDNLLGCGTFGRDAPASCSPLTREMRHTDCQTTSTWWCGEVHEQDAEASVVVKRGPEEGGVLCCRDAPQPPDPAEP